MSGIYDQQRKKITVAVLHHTVTPSTYTWKQLSEIGRTRTYQGYPHSFHYDPQTKEETFIAYHYLVYPDGRTRKCLDDADIGWHAGDWEVNTKSIAISFVGDYTKLKPNDKQIKAVADILRPYDQAVGGKLQVLNHKEIKATACPASVADYRGKIIQYINEKPQGGESSMTWEKEVEKKANKALTDFKMKQWLSKPFSEKIKILIDKAYEFKSKFEDADKKLSNSTNKIKTLENDIFSRPNKSYHPKMTKKAGWKYKVEVAEGKRHEAEKEAKKATAEKEKSEKRYQDAKEILTKKIEAIESLKQEKSEIEGKLNSKIAQNVVLQQEKQKVEEENEVLRKQISGGEPEDLENIFVKLFRKFIGIFKKASTEEGK